jgi:hypothetical protein
MRQSKWTLAHARRLGDEQNGSIWLCDSQVYRRAGEWNPLADRTVISFFNHFNAISLYFDQRFLAARLGPIKHIELNRRRGR